MKKVTFSFGTNESTILVINLTLSQSNLRSREHSKNLIPYYFLQDTILLNYTKEEQKFWEHETFFRYICNKTINYVTRPIIGAKLNNKPVFFWP